MPGIAFPYRAFPGMVKVVVPGPNDVRLGVPTGITVGNYVPADQSKYLEDETYGSLGTEFTGTLVPFQATYECEEEVVLEVGEVIIFEGCD